MHTVSSHDAAPRRLYMDNAATSFPKPNCVLEAVTAYATELGASAGRGAYREALQCADLLARGRQRLNRFFHGQNPDHFIYTFNCTDALNLAIKGLVDESASTKAHAICTCIDHNSILRPLHALEQRGYVELSRILVESSTGLVDPDDVRRAIKPQTRFIAITHVSNVTGTIQPLRQIGQIARESGVPFIVDAAQSAGHLPIDLQADPIDFLAAPGHKGLLGPLGTGFLYIRPGLEKILRPLKEGGTGSQSELAQQPDFLPDKFEAGSHNVLGIAGLSQGVQYLIDRGIEQIAAHDQSLIQAMIEGLSGIDGLTYYGPQGVAHRAGVFSVRIETLDPGELSAILETQFGILTRSGLHCAPLIHQALGTATRGGTTRLSFGPFLSVQDVQYAADALAQIAMNTKKEVTTTARH